MVHKWKFYWKLNKHIILNLNFCLTIDHFTLIINMYLQLSGLVVIILLLLMIVLKVVFICIKLLIFKLSVYLINFICNRFIRFLKWRKLPSPKPVKKCKTTRNGRWPSFSSTNKFLTSFLKSSMILTKNIMW